MKYAREIKVGALATICIFLLFFGFNFLKGVNIFSPTNSYHGRFTNLHGLEEQAAVNILGHKVGQVDAIHYDFTADTAFCVDISIRKDIKLPQGTKMALVSSGLLGGMAIELQLPADGKSQVAKGSHLPTTYVPGLVETVQEQLLTRLAGAVEQIDTLVANVNRQLAGDHLNATLANADRVSSDLTVVSRDLKHLIHNRVPAIVNNADTTLANLNVIVADVREADLKATIARVDTAVDQVNVILAGLKSQEGTLGQLIYNKSLYTHIDSAVVSADSLLVDLKANPKRYVHFSLFGAKEKKKKK